MTRNDSEEPGECLTIISPIANATIFEFHRQRLADQGYQLSSKVLLQRFELVGEDASVEKLFDGKSFYAATYVKSSSKKENN